MASPIFGHNRKVNGVASVRNLGLVAFTDNGEKQTRLMCQLGTSEVWYTLAADGSKIGVKQANGWIVKELNARLNTADQDAGDDEADLEFEAVIAAGMPQAEQVAADQD